MGKRKSIRRRHESEWLALERLVRERMQAKGIETLTALCSRAGIPGSNLSQSFLGKKCLSFAMAEKLAVVLGCEAKALLDAYVEDSERVYGELSFTAENLKFLAEVTPALAPFIKQPFSTELLRLLWRERIVKD